MRRIAPFVLLLALGGCGSGAPGASDDQMVTGPVVQVPEPARPNDFNKPLDLKGNEPFWSLRIRGDRLTLTRPGQPDVNAHWPNPRIEGDRAEWLGVTPEGEPMKVVLTLLDCSDGMSDVSYPMTAEVSFRGVGLKGCAIPVAP